MNSKSIFISLWSTRPHSRFCRLAQERLVEKEGLDDGPSESNHSETAVNDFLLLSCGDLVRGELLQKSSVKTKVTGFTLSIVLVESGEFDGGNGQENLNVCGESDTARGAENVAVLELGTREVNSSLLYDDTHHSKHAHTSVLQLSPTSVFQVSLDVRPATVNKDKG